MEDSKSKKRRTRRKTATETRSLARVYVIGGTPCTFRYPESEYRATQKWKTPAGTLVVELVRTKPS